MKRNCVQQKLLTYKESGDELAKSTYNISIWFWILFTKKMTNVDKDIFEGIVRYELFNRWWYIRFITQQAHCLRDHNFLKRCYCQMVSQMNVKNISSLNLRTVLKFSTTFYKSAHFT